MLDAVSSDILVGITNDPNVILDAKKVEWSGIWGCSDPEARPRAARVIKGARVDALQSDEPVTVLHGIDMAEADAVF